jgi:phosphoglycolate phosphatase-like HAD superfamily hydrolase
VAELIVLLATREEVQVGLLTGNTRQGAHIKLRHFALHEHLTLGGYGDEHLDRNLVAVDALAELSRLHNGAVERHRIWVIGDTPHDVCCARHIGAKALAVLTGSYPRAELEDACPDALLDDLGDVPAVLKLLAD